MKNQYIGKDQYGEMIFQKLNENGIIKGFDTYTPMELQDGEIVLSQSSWTHKAIINGIEYKSGMVAAPIIEITNDLVDARICETTSCEVCSAVHDSDDAQGYSSNPTWCVINECQAVCLGCRSAEDTLVKLVNPSDIFKSKNLEGIDLNDYTEIKSLFCDASGLGSEGELAYTKSRAIARVAEIMDNSKTPLYAGLSGIGQFQVYVSIYKKNKKTNKSNKTT